METDERVELNGITGLILMGDLGHVTLEIRGNREWNEMVKQGEVKHTLNEDNLCLVQCFFGLDNSPQPKEGKAKHLILCSPCYCQRAQN